MKRFGILLIAPLLAAVLLGGCRKKDHFGPYYGTWKGTAALTINPVTFNISIFPSSAGPLGRMDIDVPEQKEFPWRLRDISIDGDTLSFVVENRIGSDLKFNLKLQDKKLVGTMERLPVSDLRMNSIRPKRGAAQPDQGGAENAPAGPRQLAPAAPGAGLGSERRGGRLLGGQRGGGRLSALGQAQNPPPTNVTLEKVSEHSGGVVKISPAAFVGSWKLVYQDRNDGVAAMIIEKDGANLKGTMNITQQRTSVNRQIPFESVQIVGSDLTFEIALPRFKKKIKASLTYLKDSLVGRTEPGPEGRPKYLRFVPVEKAK